jgi:hypothetical protein
MTDGRGNIRGLDEVTKLLIISNMWGVLEIGDRKRPWVSISKYTV